MEPAWLASITPASPGGPPGQITIHYHSCCSPASRRNSPPRGSCSWAAMCAYRSPVSLLLSTVAHSCSGAPCTWTLTSPTPRASAPPVALWCGASIYYWSIVKYKHRDAFKQPYLDRIVTTRDIFDCTSQLATAGGDGQTLASARRLLLRYGRVRIAPHDVMVAGKLSTPRCDRLMVHVSHYSERVWK